MRSVKRYAIVLAALVVTVMLLATFALSASGFARSLPAILMLVVLAGWFLYTLFRYRFARQEELLHVLATAAEAQLPLVPAIRAYLRDRPVEGKWGWLDVALLFTVPPAYWLYRQRDRFDRRADDLAELLEEGIALPDALRAVRGAAPREFRVAAAVGENTGRLATCLRNADRDRLASAWFDLAPRLIYPLLLLFFVVVVAGYFMMLIMPRIARIYSEFHTDLPAVTLALMQVSRSIEDNFAKMVLTVFISLPIVALIITSPSVRWHLPLLGRLLRWEAQGLILRMLGPLLAAQRTVPEALELLNQAADLPPFVQRRLAKARRAVERGDGLGDALYSAGLVPASMKALIASAEHAGTLPWALVELGELRAGKAVRLVRRMALVLAPTLVVAVGLVVGFVVLGMFMPLINLIAKVGS